MKKSEALNILGLSEPFDDDDLKKAWRKKVIENHPDRFQDPAQKAKAEEQTKLINEAHDVLESGKWDPEFGGAGYGGAGAYGGNGPYRSPYVNYGNPNSGPEWVGVDPEAFYRWTQQAAQQQQQQGYGYDPFNPFAGGAGYANTPPTPEERAESAHQDVRIGIGMLVVKIVLCAVLAITGNIYDAALTWAVITYLLLFASNYGSCSWIVILVLIPLFYSIAAPLETAAERGGIISIIIIGTLFISALYFDFRDIRNAVKDYRQARKDAK